MSDKAKPSPEQLYATALQQVEQSQPADALKTAKQLLQSVQNRPAVESLPALNLLGEVSIELGAVDSAREYFEKAVALDPQGEIPEARGGGAEKFLWLAQLCEAGGAESVRWFERGAAALQTEIAALERGGVAGLDEETLLLLRTEKKRKLANTLCGIVEVYMTDLSWEDDAEARCESLITQAMAVEDETSCEILQTLASVRLSQDRKADAQAALRRSLEAWLDLEPEDPAVPDFATKISLARLLMEAEMNADAMVVLDRLVQEDDQSVEAWYLGGWCQWLMAEAYESAGNADAAAKVQPALKGSRRWLQMALKLYALLEYEDERLAQHAQELVGKLDATLGPAEGDDAEDEEADGEYAHWDGIAEDDDDEEDDDDAEMAEA